jgi:hypothetical protein
MNHFLPPTNFHTITKSSHRFSLHCADVTNSVTDSDNTLIKPRSKCGALLKDSVAIVSMLVVKEGDLKASAKPDSNNTTAFHFPFSFPTNLSKNLQNSASLPNLRFLLSQIFIPLGVNSNYRAAARIVAFQATPKFPDRRGIDMHSVISLTMLG